MRTMRLSNTVSPFGVGAILDVLGESLMGVDISEWDYDRTTPIPFPRLERALGVHKLRSAPSVPSYPSTATPGIPYQRFPRWLFCQNCRRMRRMQSNDETGDPPKCKHCTGALVPMRFIAVCTTRGHAMDVPWDRWAHSEATESEQQRCRAASLVFETGRGRSTGLSSLLVRCTTCNSRRDLGDLTTRDALTRIGVRCNGKQPWQPGSAECDARLAVAQRGATNVTISETTTALDIPEPAVPVRDVHAEIRRHRNFSDVQSAPEGDRAVVLIAMIAEDVDTSEDVVRRVVAGGGAPDDAVREARAGLLTDEWQAFRQAIDHPGESTGSSNFVVSATAFADDLDGEAFDALAARIGDVVLVHRLREVRVLHGFRRYDASADLVGVDLGPRGRDRWLPAVESFGEGVFLALNEHRLTEWENDEAVVRRIKVLERRRRESLIGSRFVQATPRLVLVHTVAHLLMRRLAFSSGYSAASLRERIYADTGDQPQAGMLVYTAAGDSEGTLGGLVRQGEQPRLAATLLAALEEAAWCSADPLCRESRGQGLGSLNLSACHGCCLVAETSCERSNVLLDRVLVVGDPETPGFFSDVILGLQSDAVAAR